MPGAAPFGGVPAAQSFPEYNFGIVAAAWSLPATVGASRCASSVLLPFVPSLFPLALLKMHNCARGPLNWWSALRK